MTRILKLLAQKLLTPSARSTARTRSRTQSWALPTLKVPRFKYSLYLLPLPPSPPVNSQTSVAQTLLPPTPQEQTTLANVRPRRNLVPQAATSLNSAPALSPPFTSPRILFRVCLVPPLSVQALSKTNPNVSLPLLSLSRRHSLEFPDTSVRRPFKLPRQLLP